MHYFALVLVPPDVDDIRSEVSRLLAPHRDLCAAPHECELDGIEEDAWCDECAALTRDTNLEHPKWDWWMIGGRFDGKLSDQPPDRIRRYYDIVEAGFKERHERDDGTVSVEFRAGWDRPLYAVRDELFEANVVQARDLPTHLVYQVIVTPSRDWHEVGSWDKDTLEEVVQQWEAERRSLLAAHEDCWVVGVDVHQ